MPPTGERLEIERLTSRSERGHWKSTRKGNSLTAYSTARPVLNGGREETCRKVTRLAPTQLECAIMPHGPCASRQELLALLGRIVGTEPLPSDLQRQALAIFAEILQAPDVTTPGAPTDARVAMGVDSGGTLPTAADTAVASRRLIYVHGICRHVQGFSDAWWT